MIHVIDEFLRFEPFNQLYNRRPLKNTQICGTHIAEGSLLTLRIGAANRNPAQFEQPNDLLLKRAKNRHLAFGLGIHPCAGMSLARLEGRIAIGRFLQRFLDCRLTKPHAGRSGAVQRFLESAVCRCLNPGLATRCSCSLFPPGKGRG